MARPTHHHPPPYENLLNHGVSILILSPHCPPPAPSSLSSLQLRQPLPHMSPPLIRDHRLLPLLSSPFHPIGAPLSFPHSTIMWLHQQGPFVGACMVVVKVGATSKSGERRGSCERDDGRIPLKGASCGRIQAEELNGMWGSALCKKFK
jgi:hypothetical protein